MCTGCEATEGNDPLLCACGKHSAKYAAGKGKEARPKWLVYSSARPSEKPKLVTTRSQKAGALQAVTELCKGHFSKRSAPAPAAQPAQPIRQARGSGALNYDDTTRQASRPAGPGRGIKRSMDVSAVGEAEHVLKQPKASEAELRVALGRLTQEHRVLQRWYSQVVSERDQAHAMLADEYQLGQDPEADRQRRAMVTELVGEGYDMGGSCRTFHRHKAMALLALKQIAGQDVVKQQQLAEAMLHHYSSGEAEVAPATQEYEAHCAVIEGLVESLDTLRKRNNGRFPSKDRITQEVLLGAATLKAKDKMLSAIGTTALPSTSLSVALAVQADC